MNQFKGTEGDWYLQHFTDAYTNIIRCNDGEGHDTLFIGSAYSGSDKKNRYNALLMSNSLKMFNMLVDILESIEDGEAYDMYRIKELIHEATTLPR